MIPKLGDRVSSQTPLGELTALFQTSLVGRRTHIRALIFGF